MVVVVMVVRVAVLGPAYSRHYSCPVVLDAKGAVTSQLLLLLHLLLCLLRLLLLLLRRMLLLLLLLRLLLLLLLLLVAVVAGTQLLSLDVRSLLGTANGRWWWW